MTDNVRRAAQAAGCGKVCSDFEEAVEAEVTKLRQLQWPGASDEPEHVLKGKAVAAAAEKYPHLHAAYVRDVGAAVATKRAAVRG